eukprot:1162029-Pelagomonas_calceolata.AAC.5
MVLLRPLADTHDSCVTRSSYSAVPLPAAEVCTVKVVRAGHPTDVMVMTTERLVPALEWGCVCVEWREAGASAMVCSVCQNMKALCIGKQAFALEWDSICAAWSCADVIGKHGGGDRTNKWMSAH